MIPSSALYVGRVVHTRLHPCHHRLTYACYWLLLDLERLDALDAGLRLFSRERFNVFSMRNADYGDGSTEPLRKQAKRDLAKAGIDLEGGRILLLSMPRILGHGFNPLSVYFCYRADGTLAALIYEVHNTFKQRHSYVIPALASQVAANPVSMVTPHGGISQTCSKTFYVSPFLDMDLTYRFEIAEPSEQARVGIRVYDKDQLILTASLSGDRVPLTDTALMRVFATHPLLTLKVVAAIHWEALRLWWKGVRLVPRPEPPEHRVTISNVRERTDHTE